MRIIPCLVLVFFLGCESGSQNASSITTDSAGIRVVESVRPTWGLQPRWALAPDPHIVIGTENGDEAEQLYWVQDAGQLPDGSIVVANAGTGELRFFDSTGTFARQVGREGGGPGEFAAFSSMRFWQLPDGRLLISDQNNDRVNVFTDTGEYLDLIRLVKPTATPRAWLEGVFSDGTLLVRGIIGGGRLQGPPGTIIENSSAFQHYTLSGKHITDVVEVASRPRYVHEYGGITRFPYIPFTQPGLVTVQDTTVLVLSGEEPTLKRYDRTGLVVEIMRWDVEQSRRTAEVWADFVETTISGIEDEQDRRWYRSYYQQDLPLPELVPLADALMVDALGYIWIRRDPVWWTNDAAWDVLSPDGEWMGQLNIPNGLRVFEIGPDYILGLVRDELGVERIQLYSLDRSASAA